MQNKRGVLIRELKANEIFIPEDLLYEAHFQAHEANPIPRDVIHVPGVRAYIQDFGKHKDDYCLAADLKGKTIGAVWVWIGAGEVKGYGNVDDKTTEFTISLFKEYRNQGFGSLMMEKMITYLTEDGYEQCSLSVEKRNYAVRMNQKLGFKIIDENEDDFIMLLKL